MSQKRRYREERGRCGAMTLGYYSRSLDGHRAAYLDFVIARLGGGRLTAGRVLNSHAPVLFLMIEENFGLYVFGGLWRAILGRRTVGLMFRPGPAIAGQTLRLRLKRMLLSGLRWVPTVRTLSIIPAPLVPGVEKIVDGWIHDFQLWDLSCADRRRVADLRAGSTAADDAVILMEACAHAAGRPLLVALGMQNHSKGISHLAAAVETGQLDGWAVIIGGSFSSDAARARDMLEAGGAKIVDRFLTDAEMLALYAAADAVWCFYDPSYDQASGILGRALQLGVPAVVRRGSVSEALCRDLGVPHAATDGSTDLDAALNALPPPQPDAGAELAERLEAQNMIKLRDALGLTGQQP